MINALFGGEQLGWQLAELAIGTLCARSVPKAFPLGPARRCCRRGCVLLYSFWVMRWIPLPMSSSAPSVVATTTFRAPYEEAMAAREVEIAARLASK